MILHSPLEFDDDPKNLEKEIIEKWLCYLPTCRWGVQLRLMIYTCQLRLVYSEYQYDEF